MNGKGQDSDNVQTYSEQNVQGVRKSSIKTSQLRIVMRDGIFQKCFWYMKIAKHCVAQPKANVFKYKPFKNLLV